MPFTNTFVKVKSRWQLKTLHDSTVLFKNAAVYPSSSAMSSLPTIPSATNLVTSEGDENENEEEGNLLEELWPRETKPLLNYQVRLPWNSPIVQDVPHIRHCRLNMLKLSRMPDTFP